MACGKGSDHVKLLRLNLSGNAYACSSCEIRHGLKKLRREFDRQLGKAVGAVATLRQCVRGCGAPVFMRPNGTMPSFCYKCEREWRQLNQEARGNKNRRQVAGKRSELDVIDDHLKRGA